MPYTINKSDGSFLVTVNDRVTDKSATSLSLPARSVATYGVDVAENFVYLLENFASATQPQQAITGQLWFDNSANVLRQFFGGSWTQVSPHGFGNTADVLAGTTIAGLTSSTNRIAGASGYALATAGSTTVNPLTGAVTAAITSASGLATTVTVLTGEGKVIAVASPEAIPNASLPNSIVLQNRSFPLQSRFPSGLVAGLTLASDSASYTYGGSNQFSNILTSVPFLLSGDDLSTTPNHLAINVPANIASYSKYLVIETLVANTNTGPTVASINGIGEVPVLRRSGVPLSASDLLAGYYYRLIYDGTEFRVDDAQANGYVGPPGPQGAQGPQGSPSTVAGPIGPQGPAGTSGTPSVFVAADANQQQVNSGITTLFTLNLTPTLPSPVPANYMVVFSPVQANIGACAINGAPFLRADGSFMQKNDLVPGERIIAIADGKGSWYYNGLTYGEVQRVVENAVLYVDVNSGDDNTGTGAQATPFKTLLTCLNYALNNLSFPGGIQIFLKTPGTYDVPEYFPTLSSTVSIIGDPNNQAGYILARSTATAALLISSCPILNLTGLTLVNPGINNAATLIANGGRIVIDHVTCTVAPGRDMGSGSVMQINTNSSIGIIDNCIFSGNASTGSWVFCNGGNFGAGNLAPTPVRTITFVGSPQYAYVFNVNSLSLASLLPGLQFVGPVTGNQYGIANFGVLSTANRKTNFIPGQSTYNFNNGLLT